MMAFSTFVFDTLDVSTRLGRYIIQELLRTPGRLAAVVATAVTCAIPLGFILWAEPGSWKYFWTLFGTSNQLLAALSLMGVTVWLKKEGRRFWYTLIPTVFVSVITLSALVLQIRDAFFGSGKATSVQVLNGAVSAVLLALAASLMVFGARAMLGSGGTHPTAAPAASS
jgi:carbon starvation protein